jgi:hypothetical protein
VDAAAVAQLRDMTDPQGRRRGPQVAHGTMTRWNERSSFTRCRQAQNNAARVRGRARAQTVDDRGCAEVPQQTPSATGPAAAVHLCRRASHASRRTRSRAGEQPEAVAQPRCDLLRGERRSGRREKPGGGAGGQPVQAPASRGRGWLRRPDAGTAIGEPAGLEAHVDSIAQTARQLSGSRDETR